MDNVAVHSSNLAVRIIIFHLYSGNEGTVHIHNNFKNKKQKKKFGDNCVSLQTVAAHPYAQKGSTTKKRFGDNCVSSQTGAGKWRALVKFRTVSLTLRHPGWHRSQLQ